MEVVRGIEPLPLEGESVITVGFFDGVHRGHQSVIRRMVGAADDRGLRSVAITFDRHPREVLTPGAVPPLLTTLERKAGLVADIGVDVLVVLEFDEGLSRWTAEEFVARVLAEGLGTRHATVGANFTFGHRALGDVRLLTDLGAAHGFSVEGVTLLEIDGRPVSSTSIREALVAGDLTWPAEALGRRYVVEGTVVPGAGRGRDLGYPTANLDPPPLLLLPGGGVYAGRGYVGEDSWPAAINVGTNPTFGSEPFHVEAFLLGFEGDIKGETLAVEFWERLRDEVKFEAPEALARQIDEDVERTRRLVT